MTAKRIAATILIAAGLAAAGATAAQAATPQTLYRGSAPATATLYRG